MTLHRSPARSPRSSGIAAGFDASLVDARLPVPLYHQIYLLLRDTIVRGDLASGDQLPGELELAQTFNVSRITVKRALNELASDAFVTRHRGRGTIVTPVARMSVIHGSFETLLDALKLMGDQTQMQLVEVSNVLPHSAVAQLLKLGSDRKVQRAIRVRTVEGVPFSHLVSYVPLTIARSYSKTELASTPLLKLLERAGSRIDEADQWITAVPADPSVAQALGVSTGSPLLRIERVMRDTAGVPVELIHAHYRSDRFVYFMQQQNLSKKDSPTSKSGARKPRRSNAT